jgi:hypothetical protein
MVIISAAIILYNFRSNANAQGAVCDKMGEIGPILRGCGIGAQNSLPRVLRIYDRLGGSHTLCTHRPVECQNSPSGFWHSTCGRAACIRWARTGSARAIASRRGDDRGFEVVRLPKSRCSPTKLADPFAATEWLATKSTKSHKGVIVLLVIFVAVPPTWAFVRQ